MARRASRRWGPAIAGALSVHLAVVLAVVLTVKIGSPPSELRAVTVQLLTPPRPAPLPKRRRREPLPIRVPLVQPPPVAVAVAPGPVPIQPPSGPSPADVEGASAARATLRAALGCDHASFLGLSDEERRRCQGRIAAAGRGVAPLALNLDPRGLYARNPDQEPYLLRRPKNGCKVRAAGDHLPMGRQGAAAGISCGKAF